MEKRTVQKLGLLCISVLLCSVASWWSGHEETAQQVQKLVEQPVVEQLQEIKVTVCVSGAVVKPGLYEVTKGSRAQQVIELAGGVTEEADMDRVNLAQLCKDGGHIKVPRLSKARMKKLEAEKSGGAGMDDGMAGSGKSDSAAYVKMGNGAAKGASKGENIIPMDSQQKHYPDNKKGKDTQISLNSATETELMQLPGVGAATARRIVAFRNQYRFQSIEDIMKIPGIGPAKFAKMKAYLVL